MWELVKIILRMARTVDEIINQASEAQQRVSELYELVTAEVNATAELAELNSQSKTSDVGLWKFVWSALAFIQEAIWEERRDEMQAIVDSGIPGTDAWMHQELLKFQYGDVLQFDANASKAKYFYDPVTPEQRIIKRCAIVSAGGVTQIKVAKEDVSGNPVPLEAEELAAFAAYVRQIQWAGSNIAAPTSFAADKLNAPITVYYNGTVKLEDIKPLIEAAFNEYLSRLPFNGEYKVSAHQDAIQAVADVNDVVMGNIQAKAAAGNYVTVNRVYYPVAGYIEKDPDIAFDDMITYIPQ